MNNKKKISLTCAVCILPAVAGLILYNSLPAEIPVQWNFGGQASSYAPKWFAAFGTPIFLMLFNIFCHVKVNGADAELKYPETAKIFIKWAMPFISVGGTAFSLASVLGVSAWAALAVSVIAVIEVLFGCLVYEGNADGIGSRDFPWSKSVKSAKIGGKLFMAAGMIAVVVSVLGKEAVAGVIIVLGIILAVLASSKSE